MQNQRGEGTKVTTIPNMVRTIGEVRRLCFTGQKTHTSKTRLCEASGPGGTGQSIGTPPPGLCLPRNARFP
jgi:hypothetical protein